MQNVMTDENHMRRAIELAKSATGWTNPNPLVGAVIVKNGRVIGEGCHERYGQFHAERNALLACSESPRGATIYVTLEPCNHTGKQPPCVDALIEAGVSRVVVGSRDPNPLVSGKGNARLRAAGIGVEEDFLREECDAINPIFFHYITTKTPYVVAKWAMTADGKIAAFTGDSRWVSGDESRRQVHDLRHRLAGIMVGIGTILADDPSLTARRDKPSNQPVRIVCDSALRIPIESKLVQTARDIPVVVATAIDTLGLSCDKVRALENAGVKVISCPDGQGRVDLSALVIELGSLGIDSILLEGGATLNWQAFNQGIVSEVVVYLAPKIVGGMTSPTPVGGKGFELMYQALDLGKPSVQLVGDDVRLSYKPKGGFPCSLA